MACTIRDIPVLSCPDQFHPELLKALVAFPTRTTFYMQSMLVAFNAAMDVLIKADVNKINPGLTLEERTIFELHLRRKTGIGSLHQFIVMVLAMSCTSLVLGFAPQPTLDFHSALVVIYILVLSSTTIVIAAPTYGRLGIDLNTKKLNCAVFLQGSSVFIFITMLLAKASTFGPSYCCNHTAKAHFFRSFSALHGGRRAGWVLAGIVMAAFIFTIFYRAIKGGHPETEKSTPSLPVTHSRFAATDKTRATIFETTASVGGLSQSTLTSIRSRGPNSNEVPQARTGFFVVYIMFWTIMVVNTELLIRRNSFAYAFRGDREVTMSNLVYFAQTLQVPQVLTFFTPFANAPETYRKICMVPDVWNRQVKARIVNALRSSS